jgi:hypothetical protein
MDGHFQVTPERLSLAAGRLAELAARVESEGYSVRQSGAGLALATVTSWRRGPSAVP